MSEINRGPSETVAWINTDHDKPLDEQVVLGYWPKNRYLAFPLMETLRYHADMNGDGDLWYDAHGEESDPPAYWTAALPAPLKWSPVPSGKPLPTVRAFVCDKQCQKAQEILRDAIVGSAIAEPRAAHRYQQAGPEFHWCVCGKPLHDPSHVVPGGEDKTSTKERTDMECTRQQVFDAAWKGLKSQGWQKTGEWGTRAKLGRGSFPASSRDGCLRCAFAYADKSVDGISMRDWQRLGVAALVSCHDDAESPQDMERRMRELAVAWGVTIPGSEDAAFQNFKARILAPLPVTVTE